MILTLVPRPELGNRNSEEEAAMGMVKGGTVYSFGKALILALSLSLGVLILSRVTWSI